MSHVLAIQLGHPIELEGQRVHMCRDSRLGVMPRPSPAESIASGVVMHLQLEDITLTEHRRTTWLE